MENIWKKTFGKEKKKEVKEKIYKDDENHDELVHSVMELLTEEGEEREFLKKNGIDNEKMLVHLFKKRDDLDSIRGLREKIHGKDVSALSEILSSVPKKEADWEEPIEFVGDPNDPNTWRIKKEDDDNGNGGMINNNETLRNERDANQLMGEQENRGTNLTPPTS